MNEQKAEALERQYEGSRRALGKALAELRECREELAETPNREECKECERGFQEECAELEKAYQVLEQRHAELEGKHDVCQARLKACGWAAGDLRKKLVNCQADLEAVQQMRELDRRAAERELAEYRSIIEQAREKKGVLDHDENELRRRYLLLMHVDEKLAQDLEQCRAELEDAQEHIAILDEATDELQEQIAAAEAREQELRKACEAAAEWAAGYPLGEMMDGVAADEVALMTTDALREQPDHAALEAALEQARAEERERLEPLLSAAKRALNDLVGMPGVLIAQTRRELEQAIREADDG